MWGSKTSKTSKTKHNGTGEISLNPNKKYILKLFNFLLQKPTYLCSSSWIPGFFILLFSSLPLTEEHVTVGVQVHH